MAAKRKKKKKRGARTRVNAGPFVLLLFLALAGWGVTYAAGWPGFCAHGVIPVSGARVVDPQQIRQIANIEPGTNIWLINPWAIDKRIESIPYIDHARISRRLPNVIRIEVTERKPESCIAGGKQMMTIDATQRVLNLGCQTAPVYLLPEVAAAKPGVTLNDPRITRLRSIAALLASGGVHLKRLGVDRDDGVVVDRADGVRLLLGDDTDVPEKIRLINPIMAAARSHNPNVQQLDLRAVDTPVIQYRDSRHTSQNRPAQ